MSNSLLWFSTKYGKIFTRTCVGVATFSSFAVQIAINGPYQDTIRELCQLYHLGKPKPLSDEVQELINDVLKDSNLKKEEKAKIKYFNVIGQDLSHVGSINSPYGATIGIPFYFEEARKIDFGSMRLEGYDSIDWVIEGQQLMAALTLSDKAKKFGLMREIYSCDVWDALDNALVAPFCILFPAEFARRVNKKQQILNKSTLKSRSLLYFVCFSMGLLMYKLLKDPLKHISDKKNDELAALTGPDYLEGGIEFYEHLLMQNKAIRNLLGKAGESRYDQHGNENYIIFFPRLPITKRLEYLKKLQEKQVSTA